MSDDLVLTVRTRGAARATSEIGRVNRAIDGLDRTATRAAGRGLAFVAKGTAVAGAGLLGLGAASAKAGLQFNASMEQNEVAFTQFLGGVKPARKELKTLFGLAKETPFEMPQITMAARRLLAFKFGAKETNDWLRTIGDAASGVGAGSEGIDRMVTAIGQMKSKGRLQTEELMQLQELGLVDVGQLAKDLGLTRKEMANVGNENVSSTKALKALKKQWDKTFGGQSKKQAQTWNGQLSTMKDNFNQLMGTITEPVFGWGKAELFPQVNSSAEALNKIFGRQDIDLAEKIKLSRKVLRHKLGPVVEEAGDAIAKLDLDDKLAEGFAKGAPKLANAAIGAAPDVAKAFWGAFWNSDPEVKALLVGIGALKAGSAAKGRGGTGGIAGALSGGGPLPVYVVNGVPGWSTPKAPTPGTPGAPGPTAPGGKGRTPLGKGRGAPGRVLGRTPGEALGRGGAAALALGILAPEIDKQLGLNPKSQFSFSGDPLADANAQMKQETKKWLATQRPTLGPGAAQIAIQAARAMEQKITLHAHFNVSGKELAKVVVTEHSRDLMKAVEREQRNQKARSGRR